MRNDKAILNDILDAIRDIKCFTEGVTKERFVDNREKQYAVIRAIEIIGEAVKNISRKTRAQYPDVERKAIAGMRDKLIHSYFGVDKDLVWSTVEIEISELVLASM